MAMLGFVGIALTELSKQTSSLEQFGAEWGTVLLWSVLLTVGTLAPKFVSGSSLAVSYLVVAYAEQSAIQSGQHSCSALCAAWVCVCGDNERKVLC